MKSYRKELWFEVPTRRAFVNITRQVETCLQESGVRLLYPPRDTGFFWSTAIQDPDGNLVEFTELRDEWFEHLEARRAEGMDVVVRWRAVRGR